MALSLAAHCAATYARLAMVRLEQLAEAALAGEALALRSLAQDWLRENPRLADCPRPLSDDQCVLAVAAGLVELFADRLGQQWPAWSGEIGPLPRPRHLVRAAETMKRLRRMCEIESPLPLRKRNLYAPAQFLQFA
jgi:hypothetical protein